MGTNSIFISIVSDYDPIQLEESVLELILLSFVLRLLAMRGVFCVTLLCWKQPVILVACVHLSFGLMPILLKCSYYAI